MDNSLPVFFVLLVIIFAIIIFFVYRGLIGDKGPDGDKGPIGDKGPVGDKGPDGDAGSAPPGGGGGGPPAGSPKAYGYAVGNDTSTITGDTDVTFNLGARVFPNAGFISVPGSSGTEFMIAQAGVYEYMFHVVGEASPTATLSFTIFVNGSLPTVGGSGYIFRSDSDSSTAEPRCINGHGYIQLATNDRVTLRNRTYNGVIYVAVAVTNTPSGGLEDGPNRVLSLKYIS